MGRCGRTLFESYAAFPMAVMARTVNHCGNNDNLFAFHHLVDDAVRKMFRVSPANILTRVFSAPEQRVYGEGVENLQYLVNESVPEALIARVVPIRRRLKVLLDFRADDDAPTHLPDRRRSRFLNSSRDKDEEGLSRCAARRDSTSESSSGLKGGSSNSKARRMRI